MAENPETANFYQSEIGVRHHNGVTMGVDYRGLKPAEFAFAFQGATPTDCECNVMSLPYINQQNYQGVLVRDAWFLHGLGVHYRYYANVQAEQMEIRLQSADTLRSDQASELWNQLVTPSQNEDAEVNQFLI